MKDNSATGQGRNVTPEISQLEADVARVEQEAVFLSFDMKKAKGAEWRRLQKERAGLVRQRHAVKEKLKSEKRAKSFEQKISLVASAEGKNVIITPKKKGPIITGPAADTDLGKKLNSIYLALGRSAEPKTESADVPEPIPVQQVSYTDILSQFKEQGIASLAVFGVSEADIEKAVQEEFGPRQKLYFRKGKFDAELAVAYLARTFGLPEEAGNVEINITYNIAEEPVADAEPESTASIDAAVETTTVPAPSDEDSDEAFYNAYAAVVAVDKNPDADASDKETVYLHFLEHTVSIDYRCAAEVYNNLGCLQMNEYADYASAKHSFNKAVECAKEDLKEHSDSQDAKDRLNKYENNLKSCRHNIAVLILPTA